MEVRGRHVVIDAFDCDSEIINDVELLERVLTDVALALGMTILSTHFHRFEPQGVTGAMILSTSHISIHTWPEYSYAALDLFTCGESEPITQIENLLRGLSSQYGIVYNLSRSKRSTSNPSVWEVRPIYHLQNSNENVNG